MKEQDFSKCTIEQLKAKAKTLKIAAAFMFTAMAIMFLSGIFFMIKKISSPVFTILPVAFLPLVIVLFKQLKAVKEELDKRN